VADLADAQVRRVRSRIGEILEEGPDFPGPLIVALSGGLDSCVLLHALRFSGAVEGEIVAAHFDHGMRDGSEMDADWTRGVCRAWGVPYRRGRAQRVLKSENDARAARYEFFEELAAETPGARVLTAHHADDQAETVLFRIVRGTGFGGLRGIPTRRDPGFVRPLLDFWREELEGYAAAVGLRWREDPTNEHLGYARNVLRRSILPDLEQRVAPGAREALTRLARIAGRNEDAWAEVLPSLLEGLGADHDSVDAAATRAMGAALRGRILRELAERAGVTLDERATERAVAFSATSRSGSVLQLGDGLVLCRELDRLRFVRSLSEVADPPAGEGILVIDGPGPGQGSLVLGGRETRVRWKPGCGGPAQEEPKRDVDPLRASFPLDHLRFPLLVRSRRPGDRITRSGGTSKVKKVLLESRVPSRERARVAVVTDADGVVVWLAGVAQSAIAGANLRDEDTMTVEIDR
jgi:tRNA(Ile)-lysidine synthase